jgi:hypothetical protein
VVEEGSMGSGVSQRTTELLVMTLNLNPLAPERVFTFLHTLYLKCE